ncbi:BNR/Asp-box repeat protein [Mycena indigotica]|uniref:BNR/Asp-box repeat protein n=1 Tax=Mycena indigotica TaxID=2126181 RepID=A0A8H6SMH3_9AGAR|nr:BNR/Asp-box repeat protein [Mycena indigotica]KAF7302106.1 BNR/Asp-box repeat protein [Mycena indigotica]
MPSTVVFSLLAFILGVSAINWVPPFTNVTIFSPPSTYTAPQTSYARTVVIPSDGKDTNVLLATWQNHSPEPPKVYFHIYRSTDLGQSWEPFSNVTDTENNWGLRAQPFLYRMTERIGKFPAGTILCAGNSIPANGSHTQIDLYASMDKGRSWEFVSHVASGGAAIPNNGETPVWEPSIMTVDHRIVVFYSDQRDPAYGQKLAHQSSSDLITWGPVVNDVAKPTYSDRPGMTIIAALPNGQYILTYEYGGAPEADFAVYYRLSKSPLTFNSPASAPGAVIRATTGELPIASPYVTWTPHGGVNGTIIVSASSHQGVFTNTKLAAPGSTWTYVESKAGASYSREVRVLPRNDQILLTGGGPYGGTMNSVTASILQL